MHLLSLYDRPSPRLAFKSARTLSSASNSAVWMRSRMIGENDVGLPMRRSGSWGKKSTTKTSVTSSFQSITIVLRLQCTFMHKYLVCPYSVSVRLEHETDRIFLSYQN